MTTAFTIALVVGTGLFFPFLYAMRVTIDAFRTSPMLELTTVDKRTAAFWILLVAAAYINVVGYNLVAGLGTIMLVIGGLGPLAWWFISRQAHAQFDSKDMVPAFTLKWFIRRSFSQYLRDQPDGMVGARVLDRDLWVWWLTPGKAVQRVLFVFDTSSETARFWASLYALGPDVNQASSFQFSCAEPDGAPLARLQLES